MNLWPVEHFFPPFFSRSALIWKKTGEKSVQLVRGSFFRKYFLWNPYFNWKTLPRVSHKMDFSIPFKFIFKTALVSEEFMVMVEV